MAYVLGSQPALQQDWKIQYNNYFRQFVKL